VEKKKSIADARKAKAPDRMVSIRIGEVVKLTHTHTSAGARDSGRLGDGNTNHESAEEKKERRKEKRKKGKKKGKWKRAGCMFEGASLQPQRWIIYVGMYVCTYVCGYV